MNQPTQFPLTGIFVQDPHDKGFTAFFAQLPNIIAEGDTEEEATANLLKTVQIVFEHQKNQELQKNTNCSTDSHVITKTFNLALG